MTSQESRRSSRSCRATERSSVSMTAVRRRSSTAQRAGARRSRRGRRARRSSCRRTTRSTSGRATGPIFPGWPRTWTGRLAGQLRARDRRCRRRRAAGHRRSLRRWPVRRSSARCASIDRNGVLHRALPEAAASSARAAFRRSRTSDLDGRNELVSFSERLERGFEGLYDKVWVYDLHGSSYGGIEWGQFGGNARHTGLYGATPPPPPPPPRRRRLRLRLRLRHRRLLLHHRLRRHPTAATASASARSSLRRPARDRQAAPARQNAHPARPLLIGPRQEEALSPRGARARSATARWNPPTLRRSRQAGRRRR